MDNYRWFQTTVTIKCSSSQTLLGASVHLIYLNSLGVVDKWGKDDDAKDKEEYEQHELFGRSSKSLNKNFQTRWVSRQLEQPKDANDGEELEDVGVLQMRGHLLKYQIDKEA